MPKRFEKAPGGKMAAGQPHPMHVGDGPKLPFRDAPVKGSAKASPTRMDDPGQLNRHQGVSRVWNRTRPKAPGHR